ncbi:MAG: hypothetical protein CML66_13080 [Rhodobacteraceae bacterium]|nr:hypothetical protein [Paracoccaceae bacterium]MAY44582.1 hypothetical protein [Paracoccaceae bacterium]
MGFRLGTSASDVFGAANGDDLVLGLQGNDVLSTGLGQDIVFGGLGDDEIRIGSGSKIVFGGADADTFAFLADTAGYTYIGDFEDGIDRVDLSQLGVRSLADVDIARHSQGAVITIGNLVIDLRTDRPDLLGAEDFIFAATENAHVLGFEDISHDDAYAGLFDDTYQGFAWTNFGVLEYDEYSQTRTSGYRPHDGDNLAYNGYGDPASFSRDANFDLESLCLSAAWSDGLAVTVEAYDDGEFIGKQVLTLLYGVSTFFELDDSFFDSVDMVLFTSQGGSDLPTDAGTGTQFGLDQMTIIG